MWILLALAAVKSVFGLIGVFPALSDGNVRPLLFAFLDISFLVPAFLLLLWAGSKAEPRYLSGIFLVAGSAFSTASLVAFASRHSGWSSIPLLGVANIPIEAFLPYFMWGFVVGFPSMSLWRRTGHAIQALTAALGILLSLDQYILRFGLASQATFTTLLSTFGREDKHRYFWALIFVLTLSAVVFSLLRMRHSTGVERRRGSIFIGALLTGIIPITLAVVIESVTSQWTTWMVGSIQAATAIVIYASLASIPFTTTYSVLVHQPLELQLYVRQAIRYALARYTVIGATIVPFAVLVVHVYHNREMRVSELLTGLPASAFFGATVLGIVLGRFRGRWFEAIDKGFFRDQYDVRKVLLTLSENMRFAATRSEIAALLESEIDRAFHTTVVTVLLRDERSGFIHSPTHTVPGFSQTGNIALALERGIPLDMSHLEAVLSSRNETVSDDLMWCASCGFTLVVPILRSSGELLGLIGLGSKKSEMFFSREDRQLLQTLAASAGLALETLPGLEVTGTSAEITDSIENARRCRRCDSVNAPDGASCALCGGPLIPISVPMILNRKFQLDSFLGEGGMGVVYKAIDLTLRRPVAIKTLPRAGRQASLRLRREARAVATVNHPNVAVIYDVEIWRGTPLLIFEFLAQGTLDQRLAKGPVPISEVLQIGQLLCSALEHLHRAGILHRDIKPNNIGFSAEGIPKLLDLGLARLMVEDSVASSEDGNGNDDLTTVLSSADNSGTLQTATGVIVGTPRYLSPEAVRGERPSELFDLWSLALTLLEAISGERPFTGFSVREVVLSLKEGELQAIQSLWEPLSRPLISLFSTALSNDRRLRPKSATEFKQRLMALNS